MLRISIYDNAVVQIGDGTTIGIDVCICTATHDIDHKVRARDWGTSFAKPISIEKNCWIGSSVTILAGVTIGHGATVLNGSVVAKDIEPEAVVTGVPAKPVENFGENDGPAQSDPSGPCNARAHQSGGILQALTYHRVPEQLPRDL